MKELTRRSFIRWVLSAGAVSACPVPFTACKAPPNPKSGPVETFESESNAVCHSVRDGKKFPDPEPSRSVDLVIIGGGASGLGAAEWAKDSDFLLLEKEGYVGGNAYAESWQGHYYSTGSAWASLFTPEVDALFKRLKIPIKPIAGLDAACFEGKWIPQFWNGEPDHPSNDLLPYPKATRESVKKFCRDMNNIDTEARMHELDKITFAKILSDYDPILRRFWDGFGMSNWGAPTESTSAFVGIQAASLWKLQRYTCEGGMGLCSKVVFDNLGEKAQQRIVLNASVYEAKVNGERVIVRYMKDGQAHAVSAKAVVVAAPKYIAKFIIPDLSFEQAGAMGRMRYAPYLVYNLCFDRVVYNQAYDNWVVGAKNFTDFIPADYVTHADGGDLNRGQVITVYAPQLESARTELLDDAKVMKKARAAVAELGRLFPGWMDHLREVRIFRRGHPMPMSSPGIYTSAQKTAGQDMPPIFFAHSDNYGEISDFAYAALNGIAATKKALRLIGERAS